MLVCKKLAYFRFRLCIVSLKLGWAIYLIFRVVVNVMHILLDCSIP